jgi:hypothetical protein
MGSADRATPSFLRRTSSEDLGTSCFAARSRLELPAWYSATIFEMGDLGIGEIEEPGFRGPSRRDETIVRRVDVRSQAVLGWIHRMGTC